MEYKKKKKRFSISFAEFAVRRIEIKDTGFSHFLMKMVVRSLEVLICFFYDEKTKNERVS